MLGTMPAVLRSCGTRCVLTGTHSVWYPAFKALIDALCYPLRLLDPYGRMGGAVASLLGLAMIPGGWWVMSTTWLLGLGIGGVGVAYWFYGLSRLLGREARLFRQYGVADVPIPEPLSRSQLRSVLRTRALPLFVCTRCRVAMAPEDCGGRCLRCGSETDCLPVSERGDRKAVWSALY